MLGEFPPPITNGWWDRVSVPRTRPSALDDGAARLARPLGPSHFRSRALRRRSISLYLAHSCPWTVRLHDVWPVKNRTRTAGPARSSTGTELATTWVVIPCDQVGSHSPANSRHGQASDRVAWSPATVAAPKPAITHFVTISGRVTRHMAHATAAPTSAAGMVAASVAAHANSVSAFAWSAL